MSAPDSFYNQNSPYGQKKGYVVPPQDMPPKKGYFFPKYRMSTLSSKGLTTFQIVGGFMGIVVFGIHQLIEFSEWRNARALSHTAQLFAQSSLFTVLYGRPQRLSNDIDAREGFSMGVNPLPQLKGRDERPMILVGSIMAEDRKRQVDLWRQATRDAAVAPYQVCYGPQHYKGNHVCTQYCIHPQEVRDLKKKIDNDNSTKNKVDAHHH